MEKTITVSKFVAQGGHLSFRRWLPGIYYEQWESLKEKVLNYQFSLGPDKITWEWAKNGRFSVKSTYDSLTMNDSGDAFSRIWKSKIPYKIKIFMWLLEKGAVLTKDNMVKRKWVGDPSCRFCDCVETPEHLFFQCVTARVVWSITAQCFGARNIPNCINQFWPWIKTHLPNGNSVFTFGLAAICWAI